MKFETKVDKYIDKFNLHHTEGTPGVHNLAVICEAIGYKDPQYFGQFKGGSLGCLINFLEDNAGCIETIIDWIKENDYGEWEECLDEHLIIEEEDENDDDDES